MNKYDDILDILPKSRKRVYIMLIKLQEATNLEIARALDWDINRITPRIHELRKLDLVVESKREKSPITGKKSIFWKPVEQKATFFSKLFVNFDYLIR